MNVPATYPPKRVNGFMISGGPDAKDRNFTYPPDVGEKLKKKYNYKVHPEPFFIKNDRKVVEEILTMIGL